jgi:hypothetical protein
VTNNDKKIDQLINGKITKGANQSMTIKPGWPPGHFYSTIPAMEDIKKNESSIFDTSKKSLGGIDLNEEGQIKMLAELGKYYELVPFSETPQANTRYYYNNPNFSYGCAITLFCMINLFKPKRIIEIGSGFSSCVALDSNEVLQNDEMEFVFVEPYPELLLSLLKPDDLSKITLIKNKVQEIGLATFTSLGKDDMLIVDSSHVVKTGGDVNHIIFEILPMLSPGVHIHFHDIGYPFEYPKGWVYKGRAWNEAYFLRSFLQYNQSFSIEFYNAFMHAFHFDLVVKTFPICQNGLGSSLWIKKDSD